MKKFKEFTAEQKYITEVGPVGALVGALVGGIAAYKGGKALWKKFKGWKENREDKKVRKKEGYDISVPVWNPATNKEELTDFHIDPKEGNKELEGLGFKIPKTLTGKFKAPTDDEKDKWQKEAKRKSQNKTAEMKNKQAKGELNPEKDLTADQQAQLADKEKEDETKAKDKETADKEKEAEVERGGIEDVGDAETYFANQDPQKSPPGWEDVRTQDEKDSGVDFKGKILTRADAKKYRDKQARLARQPGENESYMLKFSEFIAEDVMSDLKKITKSKKDSEISLDDGNDIPIDPLTAEILVKYIEGLGSSDKNKTIKQIQRTERAFMKVLGKAHGE